MSRKRVILVAFQLLLCFCLMAIIFHDSLNTQNITAIRIVKINNVNEVGNGGKLGQCLTTKTDIPFYICPHNVTKDIYISKSLKDDGIWEPKMTKILQNILAHETNVTLIDIGANIGYFGLLAAAHGRRVIAIEPLKNNTQLLQKAIVINQFRDKILLLQNVISDSRSTAVTLRLESNNQGSARIQNRFEFHATGGITVQVSSIILDDLIGLIQTPDVIIKIDVEGHECKVMAGSTELFKLFNVKAAFTEWQKMSHRKYIYGSACSPEDIQRLANQLSETGLTPYDIQHGHKLDVFNSVKWTAGDVVWK